MLVATIRAATIATQNRCPGLTRNQAVSVAVVRPAASQKMVTPRRRDATSTSSRTTWPPSSGMTGRRFTTLQPMFTSQEAERSHNTPCPPIGTSADSIVMPSAMPAAGPASETRMDREGRRWPVSSVEVRPPNVLSETSGRKPYIRSAAT
ncbi:MAG: hypothetical protein V9G12_13000 [Microthrixaceae bacterium]